MNDTTDWELLARFLAGECSESENARIQAWQREAPNRQRLVQELSAIWQSPETEAAEGDVQRLWQETALKAGIEMRPPKPRASFFGSLRARRLVPAAALLGLLAVAVTALIWRFSAPDFAAASGPELNSVRVAIGQREDLTLSDGSRVILDAGSSLRYPDEFEGGAREIYLEGEGLFEVTPDSKRPFLIHALGARIRVLGTRFNVRAWQESGKVEVVVSRGRISLSPDEAEPEDAVVVSQGQGGTLFPGRVPEPARAVDVEKHLGWLRREAHFTDTPVSEILAQLERWYDIQFVLSDRSIAVERLTVHIDSRPLPEILELIATLTDQRIKREDNLVIFSPNRLN
jgi:transmembrane sensor